MKKNERNVSIAIRRQSANIVAICAIRGHAIPSRAKEGFTWPQKPFRMIGECVCMPIKIERFDGVIVLLANSSPKRAAWL